MSHTDKAESKKKYFAVYDQPRELFLKSYHHFRGLMCSREVSIERKDDAYYDFLTDFVRTNHGSYEEEDKTLVQALNLEWMRRREYEFIRPGKETPNG